MTAKELRGIAFRLEGVVMLLEAGNKVERELAEQVREEVNRLRDLAKPIRYVSNPEPLMAL